jgi:hypothetical protein
MRGVSSALGSAAMALNKLEQAKEAYTQVKKTRVAHAPSLRRLIGGIERGSFPRCRGQPVAEQVPVLAGAAPCRHGGLPFGTFGCASA